jgi:hypothetical protein
VALRAVALRLPARSRFGEGKVRKSVRPFREPLPTGPGPDRGRGRQAQRGLSRLFILSMDEKAGREQGGEGKEADVKKQAASRNCAPRFLTSYE